jgi:hypothetical protein
MKDACPRDCPVKRERDEWRHRAKVLLAKLLEVIAQGLGRSLNYEMVVETERRREAA